MLNGLARTVLKCTLPGVPDTLQGTEFWDLSLVDPDNRRPVDYDARAHGLASGEPPEGLLARWSDGRIKQRVLARCLADRAATPALYAGGDYEPLETAGSRAPHLIAFLRTKGDDRLLVVAPRLLAGLVEEGTPPLGMAFWEDTRVPVPRGRWRDVVTGVEIEADADGHAVGDLFARLPLAVLRTME